MRGIVFALALAIPAAAAAQFLPFSQVTIDTSNLGAWSQIEGVVMDRAGALSIEFDGQRTLGEIVAQQCPGAGEEYLAGLPQRMARLNPDLATAGLTLDTTLGSPKGRTALYLPYCLGATAKRYTVQQNDTVWDIFKAQEQAPDGISDWPAFVAHWTRLNGGDANSTLQTGASLVVPTEQLTVVVPEKFAGDLVQELQSVDAIGDVRLSMPNFGVLEGTESGDVTPDQEDSCTADSDLEVLASAEKYFWKLAEALAFNDAVDNASPQWNRPLETVRLAVLDTGVMGSDEPLVQRLVRPISRAFTVDDTIALSGHKDGFHGTGVMFAAAGGHLFSAFNSMFNAIEIAPHRLYRAQCEVLPDGTPGQCGIVGDPNRLVQALTEASDRNADIAGVNISLSFLSPIDGFDRFVGPEQPLLIVTSAGNKGQSLGNAYRVYPAMFGGAELGNLITVAAVSLDRALLPSSNRSPQHVDLAAWGCNVPVMEYDVSAGFDRKLRSGTSYAAPQVLFLAAMILRERHHDEDPRTPAQLKARLVASADLEPALWGDVKHGRVVNLTKALSVHTDIVELKSGELLQGRVRLDGDTGLEVALCGDVSAPRADILKIADLGGAPNEPGAKRYLIYAYEPAITDPTNRAIEFKWCDGITAEISFEDVLSGETQFIPVTDISDIVMADTPYWR